MLSKIFLIVSLLIISFESKSAHNNNEISSSLEKFIRENNTDEIIKILNNFDLNSHPEVIHTLTRFGRTNELQYILAKGVNVNLKNSDGRSVLHTAVLFCPGLINLLLEKGADINIQEDKQGDTPLHVAIKHNRLKAIKILIENGSDINAKNKNIKTPLHLASELNHIEVIKLLIQNGADINSKSKYDFKPLHIASQNGYIEAIKLLIQNGADINSKNVEGITPLHLASKLNHIEAIKLLIQNGADINSKNKDDFTALHIACHERHIEVIKLLIQNRADINSKSENDFTPLHIASQHGYVEAIKLFIQNGADINSKTKYDVTPLHMASHRRHIEAIKLLIQNGADINSKMKDGVTPLDLASRNDHIEAINLLIQNGAITSTPPQKTTFGGRINNPWDYRVSSKYLEENPVPKHTSSSSGQIIEWLQNPSFKLDPIYKNKISSNSSGQYFIRYKLTDNQLMDAVIYTLNPHLTPSRARVTFVFPGRGQEARIPQENPTEGGRVVLVVPESQAKEAMSWLNSYTDILVVSQLKRASSSRGEEDVSFIPEKDLGLLTARRRAALYMAYIQKLDHFIMLDDNLEKFFLPGEETKQWKDIYNYLGDSARSSHSVVVSARTHDPNVNGSIKPSNSNPEIMKGKKLGSKIFYFDWKKLRDQLTKEDCMYMLPFFQNYWGEDAWMQLYLMNKGFNVGVVPRSSMLFTRAASAGRGVCAGTICKANEWLKLSDEDKKYIQSLSEESALTLQNIQQIVESSIEINATELQNARKRRLEGSYLSSSSSFSNASLLDSSFTIRENKKRKIGNKEEKKSERTLSLNFETGELNLWNAFKSKVEDHHKTYSRHYAEKGREYMALSYASLAKSLMNSRNGFYEWPTGTGKTSHFEELTALLTETEAYKNSKKNVAIVVPTQDLVRKTWKNIFDFNNQNPMNLKIHGNIVPVSAEHGSKIRTWDVDINESVKEAGNHVFIFCESSFENYLKLNPENIRNFAMIHVDEFHRASKELLNFLKEYSDRSGALVYGFSATPGDRAKVFTEQRRIFHYSIKDALSDRIIAPWQTDALPETIKDSDSFINENPAAFLRKQQHPQGGSLTERRGVIWVDSSENAEKLAKSLTENGIRAAAVYSTKTVSQNIIEGFSNEESNLKVIVAVRKLTLGFDAKNLDYAIFAKKVGSMEEYIQMRGRVLRKDGKDDKIAYFLALKDTKTGNGFQLPKGALTDSSNLGVSQVEKSSLAQEKMEVDDYADVIWEEENIVDQDSSKIGEELENYLIQDSDDSMDEDSENMEPSDKTLHLLKNELILGAGVWEDGLSEVDELNAAYREQVRLISRIQIRGRIHYVGVEDVLGDGDCAFHALGITRAEFAEAVVHAYYNYRIVGDGDGSLSMFSDLLREMYRTSGSRNLEEWYNNVGRSRYWIDAPHMRMLSFLFNRRIHIYRIGPEDVLVPRQEGEEDMIFYVPNPRTRTQDLQDNYLLHFRYNYADRDHLLDGNHYARLNIGDPVDSTQPQTRPTSISISSQRFQLENVLGLLLFWYMSANQKLPNLN